MSKIKGFDVRYGEVPHGIAGDFIGEGKKVHFFVDNNDGIILTASPDHIKGAVLKEIYNYIKSEIIERRA